MKNASPSPSPLPWKRSPPHAALAFLRQCPYTAYVAQENSRKPTVFPRSHSCPLLQPGQEHAFAMTSSLISFCLVLDPII